MTNDEKFITAQYNVTSESLVKLVKEKCSPDYLLRQVAEECAELAQACLKLIRSRNGETPVRLEVATGKYLEELADVLTMTELAFEDLDQMQRNEVGEITHFKVKRMRERLENRV